MRIEQAIERLSVENKHPWNKDNSELRKAVKLGIEALNRIKDLRERGEPCIYIPLPGETKNT